MPLIYLADNQDEIDGLGWCIDTLGRGFAETLQAHSCKPQGGDVQFTYDEPSGQIQSVESAIFCMQYLGIKQPAFGLLKCDVTESNQQFVYDIEMQALLLADDQGQCVTVGEQSRSAGPFMSRDLLLATCNDTPLLYRTWVIAP